MDQLLKELAELVGREWARRWLEQSNSNQPQDIPALQRHREDELDTCRETIPATSEPTVEPGRQQDSQSIGGRRNGSDRDSSSGLPDDPA
jgi:hypothetical protein